MNLASDAARAPAWSRGLSARTLGVLAVLGLVVAFSFSSTLVKRAETPGVLVAFWRLATVSLVWNVVLWSTGRRVALRDVRKVWIPGVFVMRLADRGLVVLTGCGHAGIINVVRHAQRLTGETRVAAVIGGFHLSGPMFEPIIEPTVAAFDDLEPELLMPAHCTGWKAVHRLAGRFPDAFVQSAVGTTISL